jgi:hypothetical protein
LETGVWNVKKCAYFNTVHNCVYFATSVLNQQRKILECFDKITLKMLADNRYISAFIPDLYDFISGLIAADTSKTRTYASSVAAIQGNVSFQSDTDNRQNFPTDQAFNIFRKQRDGFYDILRTWEADHMLPNWSFAAALGPRIRALLSLHSEPANFVHFARLFRSQLLGTCNGHSSYSVSVKVCYPKIQINIYIYFFNVSVPSHPAPRFLSCSHTTWIACGTGLSHPMFSSFRSPYASHSITRFIHQMS